MERGSARRSSLKGRERAIVNQTNIGTPYSLKGRQRAIVNQTNIVERGSARRPSLNGRAIVNQTNAGTVSKTTLGTIPAERRGGAHMGFSERTDTILNRTELN